MRVPFLIFYIQILLISCAGPNLYRQEPTTPFSESTLLVRILDSDIKIDFPIFVQGDTDDRFGSVKNLLKSRVENLKAVRPVFKTVCFDTSSDPISTSNIRYKTKSRKSIVFSAPDSNAQIHMGELLPEYVLLLSEISIEPKTDTTVGIAGDIEIEHYRHHIMAKIKYLLWDNNSKSTLYCGIEKMSKPKTRKTLLTFDDCLNMIDGLFIDIISKKFAH